MIIPQNKLGRIRISRWSGYLKVVNKPVDSYLIPLPITFLNKNIVLLSIFKFKIQKQIKDRT